MVQPGCCARPWTPADAGSLETTETGWASLPRQALRPLGRQAGSSRAPTTSRFWVSRVLTDSHIHLDTWARKQGQSGHPTLLLPQM